MSFILKVKILIHVIIIRFEIAFLISSWEEPGIMSWWITKSFVVYSQKYTMRVKSIIVLIRIFPSILFRQSFNCVRDSHSRDDIFAKYLNSSSQFHTNCSIILDQNLLYKCLKNVCFITLNKDIYLSQ